VTTTLADVQKHLLSLLAPVGGSGGVPILLGHSLESDLRALKLAHPRVIDTALSFHHPRGRPMKPGLAWLARKWLNRYIQNRGDGGHDPEEDARACLDLLRKKVENGTCLTLSGDAGGVPMLMCAI
jgi:RNA exonuclease 1